MLSEGFVRVRVGKNVELIIEERFFFVGGCYNGVYVDIRVSVMG